MPTAPARTRATPIPSAIFDVDSFSPGTSSSAGGEGRFNPAAEAGGASRGAGEKSAGVFKPALDLTVGAGGGAGAALGAAARDSAAAGEAASFPTAVAGVSVALGLGLTFPGGAASSSGAPHCSQKSPSRSSGPLQKRQMTSPDAADFPRGARSSSGVASMVVRRAKPPALGGVQTGGGAETELALSPAAAPGGEAVRAGAGGSGFAAARLETAGSAPGPGGEPEGSPRGAPHWVQNFNPSGRCELHLGHAAMVATRGSKFLAPRQTLPFAPRGDSTLPASSVSR